MKPQADGRSRARLRHPSAMASPFNPQDGSVRLVNWKHERMAQLVAVHGRSPDDAWREVYDGHEAPAKRAKSEGHRITSCIRAVVLRINYLANFALMLEVDRAVVTREWIDGELLRTYQESAKDRDWKCSLRALELMGTDRGMFVKRQQNMNVNLNLGDKEPEDLLEEMKTLLKSLVPGLDESALEKLIAKSLEAGKPALPETVEAVVVEATP